MNERIADLIQRELDGAITREELAELDAATAADPVTADERERMRGLARDLDQLAWREPGPALKENILREIDRIGAPRARRIRPRWRIDRRLAVAFAAGIALVLVVNRLIPIDRTIDPDQASGTLLAPTGATEEVDRARLELGSVWCEVRAQRSGDRLFLRARGEGDAATPVRIDWEGPSWSVASVHGIPPGELGVARGRARFVPAEPGPFTLEIELQLPESVGQAEEVRLRLGSGDPGDPTARLRVSP